MSSLPVAEHNWLSRWRAKAADDAVTFSPGTSNSRNTYSVESTSTEFNYAINITYYS